MDPGMRRYWFLKPQASLRTWCPEYWSVSTQGECRVGLRKEIVSTRPDARMNCQGCIGRSARHAVFVPRLSEHPHLTQFGRETNDSAEIQLMEFRIEDG